MNPIYLDYNATTPIDPEVAKEMRPYLEDYFGNPSSTHSFGAKTKMAVEEARTRVATLIHCDPSEIIFTSGGTESNNYAIKGAAFANRHKGRHIITSSIEHPAVFEVCRYLEKEGFSITYLPVDEFGMVHPEEVEKAIRKDTILISVMHANNEVGTIQPIGEIGSIARKHGILLHTDAAQSTGKINVDVNKLQVDLLSIAGHKLYAPKGIGALYIRRGVSLEKLIHGADHEQNLRAGTENVLEIVGLGKACEIAGNALESLEKQYRHTRDMLHTMIVKEIPETKLNGHPDQRLPNTLSLSFPNVEANTLVARLEKVAVSSGAACHSESIDVSAVLQAMQVPVTYAMGTIRISTGKNTSEDDCSSAAKEIVHAVRSLMPNATENQKAPEAVAETVKLTHYTHGLGCACKIEPASLEEILKSLPLPDDKNILVGTETSDDAAVYKLTDTLSLAVSLDFFTPIVDDPYHFGAIAAANALSDIYAMGATPLFGMNIVGFPENTLPLSVLGTILEGAQDKAKEAGISIIGGHTIEDPEPKYGMVVCGTVHPDRVLRNFGAVPGDILILTKPLGTGILSTALKRGMTDAETQKILIETMASLNRKAAIAMEGLEVHACTDITGFGLLGHLREMTKASECDAEIHFGKTPFLDKVQNFATAGIIPGGTYNNLEYVSQDINFGSLGKTQKLMLCDAQTSGGLLIALPDTDARKYLSAMKKNYDLTVFAIGKFIGSGKGNIRILE